MVTESLCNVWEKQMTKKEELSRFQEDKHHKKI